MKKFINSLTENKITSRKNFCFVNFY